MVVWEADRGRPPDRVAPSGDVPDRPEWVNREVERSEVGPREAWRILEGDWYMDVGLEQGVSYETAAKIVLAIKRRTFVDRRKRVEETPVGKELLLVPAYVRQVGGEYEVMMGKTGGLTLRVAVVGERLELISVDVWIS